MPEQCHVKFFRNGRKRGLIALLKSMKSIDESLPDIDDPVPAPERML